jgi:hypothetical protein
VPKPAEAAVSRSLSAIRPLDRILVVDALRGLCFVFMTMDHFPGDPFARFSNPDFGPCGFFTAALGFVFLSGMVGGLVYERDRASYGTRWMARRVLRRVRDLYVTQMAVLLVLVAALMIGLSGVGRWHLDLITNSPWRGLVFGSFLLYEPGYLGILPMYCFFLLLTPIVLWQFQRGNLRYVLGGSALLWMTAGLALKAPENPHGVDFGAFNPLSYQFLFVLGLAFGTGQVSIEHFSPGVRKLLFGSCLVIATASFTLRQEYAFDGPSATLLYRLRDWFSAVDLGPLRMLSFAAFGVLLYWICRKIKWEKVQSCAFRWLAFVGRHSLPVFAWSILVAYAAVAFMPHHPDEALRLLGVVVAIASLTIPAQVHAMIRRRQLGSPADSIAGRLELESARRAA